jgi:hypothetical protein
LGTVGLERDGLGVLINLIRTLGYSGSSLITKLSSSKRAERESLQRALPGALDSESCPDPLRDAKRRSERALRLFNSREFLVNDIEWDMIGELLLDADDW